MRARSRRRPPDLHFTPALEARLRARGVGINRVTLHVGRRDVPAGQGRGYRRAQDACRMGQPFPARPLRRSTRQARRAAASSRSAPPRCGCWRARPQKTAPSRRLPARPRSSSRRAIVSAAVDLLLTNFHLPRSTLFMLVSAFSGLDTMQRAYAHAIAERLPLLFLWRRLPAVSGARRSRSRETG